MDNEQKETLCSRLNIYIYYRYAIVIYSSASISWNNINTESWYLIALCDRQFIWYIIITIYNRRLSIQDKLFGRWSETDRIVARSIRFADVTTDWDVIEAAAFDTKYWLRGAWGNALSVIKVHNLFFIRIYRLYDIRREQMRIARNNAKRRGNSRRRRERP